MSNPLNIDDILTQVKSIVGAVSDVENTYKGKTSFVNQEAFVSKFRSADKTKFIGFDIYRSGKTTEFSAYNKYRHNHMITVRGFIGVRDDGEADKSFDTIQHILENIQTTLNNNLTLNGTVQNSTPAMLGDIVEDLTTGRLLWVGEVTMMVEEGQIFTQNVS